MTKARVLPSPTVRRGGPRAHREGLTTRRGRRVAVRRLLAAVGAAVAGVLLTAGPASAHALDPTLVTRVQGISPALPGVHVEIATSIADAVVLTNPNPTPVEVLDPSGTPFLTISATGVQGNVSAPYLYYSGSPPGVPLTPPSTAGAGVAPHWVQLAAAAGWTWFDPRLSPQYLQVPIGGRIDVAGEKDIAAWSIPLRYGSAAARITGALVRRPVAGRFETSMDHPPAGLAAVIGQGYVPSLSLQFAPGHQVTVLGRDGQPYLRFDGSALSLSRDSPTYRDDLLVRGAQVPTDTGWATVSELTTSWQDIRLKYPSDDPPARLAGATSPVEVARWQVPVLLDGRPGALSGAIRWIPNPTAATGWPLRTPLLVGGAILLLLVGAVLVRRTRRLAAEHRRLAAEPADLTDTDATTGRDAIRSRS